MGQIENPTRVEGTAIVNPHHSCAAIVEIPDPDARPKGQAAVGRCHGAAGEHFTISGAIAVETGAVPTGLTIDHATG